MNATKHEGVGDDWLAELLDELDKEFPSKPEPEAAAQRHVEQNGDRPAEQRRYA
jgi:hypothetical protein